MNALLESAQSISSVGIYRMFYRNWRIFTKVFWIATAPTFFEPVIYLLGLGVGLSLFVRNIEGMSYAQFISPGLVASTVMFGASFETTYDSFVRMKYERIYDAVLATPLSIEDVIGGEILWGAFRGYINSLVFLLVLVFFGLVKSPMALTLVLFLPFFSLLFAIIGMTFTALVSNIMLFNYYFTLFITPSFLFSGIFYPTNTLPEWAQTIASFTPLYHVVSACRGLVTGIGVHQALVSALIVSILSVALFLIPIALMKKRLIK